MSDFLEKWANKSVANRRACARQDLVVDVTEDLLIALEDNHISKAELARRLGKSRSYVTQCLSGSRNITLGTLADFCFALELSPTVTLQPSKMATCVADKVTARKVMESLNNGMSFKRSEPVHRAIRSTATKTYKLASVA